MENVLRYAIELKRKGRIKRKREKKTEKKEKEKEKTEIDEYANKSLE